MVAIRAVVFLCLALSGCASLTAAQKSKLAFDEKQCAVSALAPAIAAAKPLAVDAILGQATDASAYAALAQLVVGELAPTACALLHLLEDLGPEQPTLVASLNVAELGPEPPTRVFRRRAWAWLTLRGGPR